MLPATNRPGTGSPFPQRISMDNPQPPNDKSFPSVEWAALLPGPNRKQSQHVYVYRLIYLNLNQGKPGCVMTWEVEGGRLAYQIAVEREESGRLRCHCTCAD